MQSSDIKSVFLSLVRLVVGHHGMVNDSWNPVHGQVDVIWDELEEIAAEQGLSSIAVDGIDRLPDDMRPPKLVLLQWIGETLQQEQQYANQQKAAREMASLFHANHIRTYVLKGAVVAECYPKPAHRASADMDCFLMSEKGHFDAWAMGNDLMKANGYEVGIGFYKNSSFHLPDVLVENHQYMVPFRGNRRLKEMERQLQSWICEDTELRRFEGTWLYRPPVMVSALFLIEHAYSHFLHEGLTWRMILDWVMFSKKHEKEINWVEFEANIDKFGFRKFYDSYHRLGLYLIGESQSSSFRVQEKRMLDDIWAPLDLHESLHGVKAKFQLAGNYWRARWKYKYFTDITWVRALYEWVSGAVFNRNPKLN